MDLSSFPTPATMSWSELTGAGIVLGVFSILMEAAYRDRLGGVGRVLYVAIALPLAWWVGPQYAGPFLEQVAPPLFASTPTSAAMLRGTATPAQLRQALEKLDPASLEAYMDASFNAIVAELKGIEA